MPEHRFVLRDIDIPDIEGMARYRSRGGYEGARRVLTGMTPAQVLAEVDASGLQGRGGGWTRVADKWRLMPPHAPPSDAAGASRYLVVNGYESEPGLFRDRKLMERLPHRLIEGVIIAAYTLGAQVAYICVRADMVRVVRVLEEALAEARELGWLGSDIRGTGFSLDIHIHAGAGAHIAGEETAMLSLLEGRRAEPRAAEPAADAPAFVRPAPRSSTTPEPSPTCPLFWLKAPPSSVRSAPGVTRAPAYSA